MINISNFFITTCLSIILFAVTSFANNKADVIPVGELEILSILDAQGAANADLLPDLKKYPELMPMFENGALPTVSKTYFLNSDGHKILIDSGWGSDLDKKGDTANILKANGIMPESISDLLLTHMDFDHIGGMLSNNQPVYPNATIWISKPEYEAWIKDNIQKRPEFARDLAKKVAAVYKDKIKLFDFGTEVIPGIKAIDASGHTPGHTAYEITSGNKKLTIVGDAIHLAQIQLLKPELSSVYDMDMEKAAAVRKMLLDKAANEHNEFGGMHFDMVSQVKKREDGGYSMREPR